MKIPFKNARKAYKFVKEVKKKIMGNETNERSKHADTIIRSHTLFSMGAGFIPFFLGDVFAILALHLDMVRQLCRVYDIPFKEAQGKAVISALTTSTLSRMGARSLIKLIPGVGSIVGGIAVSIIAGASTYALGEVFKKHFEAGGTILDFDTDRVKKMYKEKFEKGKKVVEQWKEEEENKKAKGEPTTPMPDIDLKEKTSKGSDDEVIQKLKNLAELKDQGIISEEEFQAMKKKLIDSY